MEIPLADAIRALRREVARAVESGEREELRFRLGPIELELQLTMGREGGGEAGINFWVVALGAKGTRSSATTHTVKLTLVPDEVVLVEDRVSGRPD